MYLRPYLSLQLSVNGNLLPNNLEFMNSWSTIKVSWKFTPRLGAWETSVESKCYLFLEEYNFLFRNNTLKNILNTT